MMRTPVQNRTSAVGNGYLGRYNWGTSETAPGGAANTVLPGPCRLSEGVDS